MQKQQRKPEDSPESIALNRGLLDSYIVNEHRQRLLLTPRGKARLGSIYGYIQGLYDAGQSVLYEVNNTDMVSLAETMLRKINEQLTYLGEYGGYVDGTKELVPSYKIVLSDDGSKHGFCIAWYRAVKLSDLRVPEGKRRDEYGSADYPYITTESRQKLLGGSQIGTFGNDERDGMSLCQVTEDDGWGGDRYVYQYAMNGGLIYHGPHIGEYNSKSDYFWSIHT